MEELKYLLSLVWFIGGFLATVQGNQWLAIACAQWGVVAGLILGFLSGWFYLWAGTTLAPPAQRLGISLFVTLVAGGLCLVLGTILAQRGP